MAKRIEDLPEPNQSREESYLGVIAQQDGAELPDKPRSRIEEYLEFIALNGKGQDGLVTMHRVSDMLYTAEYNSFGLDYEFAIEYLNKRYQEIVKTEGRRPGCSAVYKNGIFGKNFDWYYNWLCDFVVRTAPSDGSFATIGVAGGITGLSKQFMETGEYSELFKVLPFLINEGVNSAGVFCGLNVVPTHETKNGVTYTVPTTGTCPESPLPPICAMMLTRCVLDYYDTALDAVREIKNVINVYCPNNEKNLVEEMHLMIGDVNNQYIVEFINNEVVITETTDEYPWMTNYYRDGAEFNEDGTLIWESLTDHPMGVHRSDLIAQNYNSINSIEDMMRLMQETLKYTQTYTNPQVWIDEYCSNYGDSYGDLTIRVAKEKPEQFQPVIDIAVNRYENRSRYSPYEVWQSDHSVVIDIATGNLYVVVQEEGMQNVHCFNIDPSKDTVKAFQGFDNKGKFLGIDENGMVVPNAAESYSKKETNDLLDKKLDVYDNKGHTNLVYGLIWNNPTMFEVVQGNATANTIVRRDADGEVSTANPSKDLSAVNLRYLKSLVKRTTLTSNTDSMGDLRMSAIPKDKILTVIPNRTVEGSYGAFFTVKIGTLANGDIGVKCQNDAGEDLTSQQVSVDIIYLDL